MKSRVLLFHSPAVLFVSIMLVMITYGRPAPGQESNPVDPVLVGAGDIADCTDTSDEATADLLDAISGTVFTTGDNAYPSGTKENFDECYDPSWGRDGIRARTYPAPGNHDYSTAGASGYFGYFGAAAGDPMKGYYSYDLGEWHIISLNSQCGQVGGCGAASPMVTWLKQDLSANPAACTLAYWHHPLFSSGSVHGSDPKMKPSWQALYDADADVVLTGHSHNYERFAPQDANGVADPQRGIREFVVGTGGKSVHGFGTIQPNSEVRNANTSGVLKLTLHQTSYDWEFRPVAGKTFTDTGSGQCHGVPPAPDTTPPTVSGVAPAVGATNVALSANAEASFSEAMDANTINNTTFTLSRPDSTLVAGTVSYSTTTNKATLDPTEALQAGTTYTATIKSGTDGVKDLAGNPLLDQDPNTPGDQDKVWSFTTTTEVACTLTGTPSADTLTGTSGDDVICGGGGPDTIKGLGGNDVLKGEAGGDKLYGGAGEDTLDGGIGTDTANFSDALFAVSASLVENTATGEGSDTLVNMENLIGSSYNDTLIGSVTNNTLSGTNGTDVLSGQDGADNLTGGGGNDTLHGESGNDSVVGSGGADNLFGEDGDDTLNSKDNVTNNDRLDGGAGTDACTTDLTEASIVSCP